MKRDAYFDGRNEGMDFALRIVESDGIDGLRKEIQYRRIEGLSINMRKKDVEEMKLRITCRVVDLIGVITCLTLHDEFGFGRSRCERFLERLNLKVRCLIEPDTAGEAPTLEDYLRLAKDEIGLELEISEGLGMRE